MKVDQCIQEGVEKLTDGKRTKMKQVLQAIENFFEGIRIVCVDKKKDTVLFGFDYLDEQEGLSQDPDDEGTED